jgi:PAS domain S-box-containing protein
MADTLYKLSTLAKLTGFGVQAIRNWERRYNLLVPQRTAGGHRLYTEHDLAALLRVRELLDKGQSIGEIAAVARQVMAQPTVIDSKLSGARRDAPLALTARVDSAELDAALARCVLEAMPHGLIVTDAAGNTEWINQGITDLCGYTLDDMKGRTPGSLLQGPRTDRCVTRRISKAIAEHKACSEEIVNYDSRNREYVAAVDIAPLWLGQQLRGFVGMIRDLTRIERALPLTESS